ncbi:hypothetical protein QHH03_29635, partial [Aphanizomenon sp. 202]|nr:hypothetical protein [Aphanizomenon sp. 202]
STVIMVHFHGKTADGDYSLFHTEGNDAQERLRASSGASSGSSASHGSSCSADSGASTKSKKRAKRAKHDLMMTNSLLSYLSVNK